MNKNFKILVIVITIKKIKILKKENLAIKTKSQNKMILILWEIFSLISNLF